MTNPELADTEERWPVESSRHLFRDEWVMALRSDTIRRPDGDGESFDRLVLEHPGAVVVLAVDDDDRVFCLRQYRHAAGRRFTELPAGLCDQEGEDPLAVARRELVEEAGLQASEWTPLASAWASPGISAEVVHYYLARGLSPADAGDFVPEHEEADMETFWAPFGDLLAAVLEGSISDTPLMMAVLLADARGRAAGPGAER